MRFFQKTSQIIIFPLGEFFLNIEASDWLHSRINQSEVSLKGQKYDMTSFLKIPQSKVWQETHSRDEDIKHAAEAAAIHDLLNQPLDCGTLESQKSQEEIGVNPRS